MLKLLNKSDIDKTKAAERQREIEEGLKLAKRVDNLREVVAREDSALSKFRSETLSTIQTEIEDFTEKKDLLYAEVQVLEGIKAIGLHSVQEKRKELEDFKKELDERKNTLESEAGALSEREAQIQASERELHVKQTDTDAMHKRISELYVSADTLNNEAERKHLLASQVLIKAEAEAGSKNENVTQREAWVTGREEVVLQKEEELRTKELKLAEDWSLLKDREKTLEREIKRIKK